MIGADWHDSTKNKKNRSEQKKEKKFLSLGYVFLTKVKKGTWNNILTKTSVRR